MATQVHNPISPKSTSHSLPHSPMTTWSQSLLQETHRYAIESQTLSVHIPSLTIVNVFKKNQHFQTFSTFSTYSTFSTLSNIFNVFNNFNFFNIFKHFQHFQLFQHFQTFSNIFKHFQTFSTFSNIFNVFIIFNIFNTQPILNAPASWTTRSSTSNHSMLGHQFGTTEPFTGEYSWSGIWCT